MLQDKSASETQPVVKPKPLPLLFHPNHRDFPKENQAFLLRPSPQISL